MQVRFEDVTMKFGDHVVLDKIKFTLPSKELLSFLGPSGSGKSTTLYLISGLLTPTSGKIYFDETDVTHLDPVKRGVGMVFQNYALYPHMTVRQNIQFPLKMSKIPKAEQEKIVVETARLTQISDQLDKFPSQLSGGQQQRVAISRAMAKSPEILLMDEPLSNLDARLRIEMREEIRRIQQETGITTVFVTHDQEEALSIADNVMILDQGEIQQISDPVSLYLQPNNLFVAKFIGTPMINIIERSSQDLNDLHPLFTEVWDQIGIRSEHFVLVDTREQALISGEVERVEQIGKEVTVRLNTGEHLLTISDQMARDAQIGQRIHLDVKPEHVLRFDLEGNNLQSKQEVLS